MQTTNLNKNNQHWVGQLASTLRSNAAPASVAVWGCGGAGAEPLPSALSVASGPREFASGSGREVQRARGRGGYDECPLHPASCWQETTSTNRHKTSWVAARGHLPATLAATLKSCSELALLPPVPHHGAPNESGRNEAVLSDGSPRRLHNRTFPSPRANEVELFVTCRGVAKWLNIGVDWMPTASAYSYLLPQLLMTSAKENTSPAATFRMKGVSVAVYANQIKGSPVPLFKVSIKKNIFDKGEFKSVSSLGRDDLPVAQYLLQQAWVKIHEMEADARKDSSDDSEIETSEE